MPHPPSWLLVVCLLLLGAGVGRAATEEGAIGVAEARDLLFGPEPDDEAVAVCLERPVRAADRETAIRIRCLLRGKTRGQAQPVDPADGAVSGATTA